MKLRVLDSGFNSGKVNMDIDMQLAGLCNPNEIVLRFYRWKPYCISLGANQNLSEINVKKAKEDGIDIVFRPTGGRAILHAEELTYSVIYPAGSNISSRNVYHDISTALLKGLAHYNSLLNAAELETIQPNFQNFYKEKISALCFAVPAKSEIKYRGKKLVGSAQKRMQNAILQHGSILCGSYHLKLVDYLQLSDEKKIMIKEELESKTTNLFAVLNETIDYSRLIKSLTDGFIEQFELVGNSSVVE